MKTMDNFDPRTGLKAVLMVLVLLASGLVVTAGGGATDESDALATTYRIDVGENALITYDGQTYSEGLATITTSTNSSVYVYAVENETYAIAPMIWNADYTYVNPLRGTSYAYDTSADTLQSMTDVEGYTKLGAINLNEIQASDTLQIQIDYGYNVTYLNDDGTVISKTFATSGIDITNWAQTPVNPVSSTTEDPFIGWSSSEVIEKAVTCTAYYGNTKNIDVKPGDTWTWTATFDNNMDPTVYVAGSSDAMPTTATATTSGNASVSGKTVTVSIPSAYSGSEYYVYVKAVSTQPTQYAAYAITFDIQNSLTPSVKDTVYAAVGKEMTPITFSTDGGSAIESAEISPSIADTGLSFDTATGKISGTPTSAKALTEYTVTATLANGNTCSAKVSVQVNEAISIEDVDTVNATAHTVKEVQLSSNIDNAKWSIVSVNGTKGNGTFTLSTDGKLATTTGTLVGTHTVKVQAVDPVNEANTITKDITVKVGISQTITGNDAVNTYVGGNGSVQLSAITGSTWSIDSVNGTEGKGTFDITDGKLAITSNTTAGAYTVIVKAVDPDDSGNVATKTVTFTVAEKIEFTSGSYEIYMTTGHVMDAYALTSNISGATFKIDGTDSGYISVNETDGKVSQGENHGTVGDHTVTVKVTDPVNPGNTATQVLNVHIVYPLAFSSEPKADSTAD